MKDGLETPTGRLKIALAASGGGHLRQLLDLEPAWGAHDVFFVSEDTALARSVARKHPVQFVPHFALGQAKLGNPLTMMASGLRNFIRSAAIVWRERPNVIVSTGAGAVFFAVAWGRLLGSKVVAIESFARFNSPSVFGKLAAPLAHHKVVQSRALAAIWPDAAVFDPLKILHAPRPEKHPLMFVTVGTVLPFDRLVGMVAELKARGEIPERVLVQSGVGGRAPEGLETVETLPFDCIQATLRDADIVVCHGGTGSLITALRQGCRVIAVPRQFALGEHYDDHQQEITQAFAARGLIEVANSPDELTRALQTVRERPPVLATTDPDALTAYLAALFSDLAKTKPRRQGRASNSIPGHPQAPDTPRAADLNFALTHPSKHLGGKRIDARLDTTTSEGEATSYR